MEETYRGYAASSRKRRSWSASNPGNVAMRLELLSSILDLAKKPLEGGGEILDVGCGSGWLLAELGSRGVEQRRLHGVDLIEERVANAKRQLPNADIRFADGRSLPFPDGHFELVTLLTALSSMPDEDSVARALQEAGRTVSPTGTVLCYEPRIANPFNRSTRLISRKTLRHILGSEEASLRITGFPPLARRLDGLTQRFYPTLARVAPTHRLSAFKRPNG